MIFLCLFASTYSMDQQQKDKALEIVKRMETRIDKTDKRTDQRLQIYGKMGTTAEEIRVDGKAILDNKTNIETKKTLVHYLKPGGIAALGIIGGLVLSRLFGATPKDIKEITKVVAVVKIFNIPGFDF